MIGRKSPERRAAAAVAAPAILLCGLTSAASAATSIVPSIGAAASWTNNIDLAPAGQEQAGEIYDVEPALDFAHDSAREHATLDYTLHALFFNGGHHEFLHSGNLVSTTQVLPDWFELDLGGQRSQGVADPAIPANSDFLFPTANLANFTYGYVRPIVRHTFRLFQLQASYTRGITDDGQVGSAAGGYRSNERDAAATVSSPDNAALVTWSASYQRTQDDYQDPYSVHFLYERASGEVGVLTISTLRLLAQGGKESNPQSDGISDGGLQSSFWAGGFEWSTGPLDDLRVLVGHRFFGRTYQAQWRRQSRLLRLQVSYTEQPTTQDSLMLGQALAPAPVVVIPGTTALTRLSPDVFLDKLLTGAATITGRLTEIGLSVSSEQRTYYAIGNTNLVIAPRHRAFLFVENASNTLSSAYGDRERSATLYVTRRLGPLMDLNLTATYGKTDLREGATDEYDTQRYSLTLTRHLGERSTLYLRGDHIKQYGDVADYKADIASVGFKVYFGNPPTQSGRATTNYGP